MVGRACRGRIALVQQQLELLAHPVLGDELGQPPRPHARLGVELLVARRTGRDQVVSRRRSSGPCPAAGSPALSSTGTGGGRRRRSSRPTAATAWSAWRGGPAEPDQRLADLVLPARRPGTPAGAVARRPTGADPVAQLQHQPLGALLADARHPGQRGDVAVGDRPAHHVGRVHREHRLGQPRARPRWRSAAARRAARSSSSAKPYRVSESSRTIRLVASRASLRRPAGRPACPARTSTARPTPPTSTTAPSGDDRGDPAAHTGDHRGSSPARPARRPSRPRILALGAAAPDVADRQRQRVGGVGRAGRRVQPQQPGHHRGHLRLVGLAGAGDGRLDLARRVGLHRQPGPRGGQDRDRAGLRGAHHRAHVVLAEHPLDGDRVRAGARRPASASAPVEVQQPLRAGRRRGSVRTTSYVRPACRAGRARPRPRRRRTGSAPGRRRAPARYLLRRHRERVFDTLPSPGQTPGMTRAPIDPSSLER